MEERARVAKDVNVIEQYFKDVQGMHDVLASGSVDGFDPDKYRADTILRRDTDHAKKQSEINAEIATRRAQIEDHHAAQVNHIQHEHKAMRDGIDAKPGPKIGIGATFAAGPTGASVGVVNPAHVPAGSTRGRDAVVLEYNFQTRSDTVTDNLFEYKQQRAMEDLAAWGTTGSAGYDASEQGHVPVLRDVDAGAVSMPVGDSVQVLAAASAIVTESKPTVSSEQLIERRPDSNQFVDLTPGSYKQTSLKLPMSYSTKENKVASEVSSIQEVFSKANNDMPPINQASADKPKPMLSNFERRFGGNDDYSRRAKNRQDIDKFFDSYVEEKSYSSEDAARDSVNEFMGSVESYDVKQSIFPRRQPITFINTFRDIHRDAEDSQTDYWDRPYNPEIKPAPVTINLPLLAGRVASIPVTAAKMLDMFVNSDNYMRTGEYAEYTIDARDVQRVENTFKFFADLPNTGIRPIWNAYISSYNSRMDESRAYALNGNDFMAGFTSGRAVGDVAMDAGGVLLFGYGAARAGHVFLKSVPRRVADLSVASALIGEPLTFEFQRASRAAGTEFMAVEPKLSTMYTLEREHLPVFAHYKEAYSSLSKHASADISVVPQHKFDLWYNYLTKRGVIFEVGSSKAIKELAQSNADGMFVSNLVCRETNSFERTIYLSENFRARVFYEEVLHALDSIKGRPRFMNVEGVDIDAFEYRAKNILINSSGKRGFSYDDFITLENHLEMVMKNTY